MTLSLFSRPLKCFFFFAPKTSLPFPTKYVPLRKKRNVFTRNIEILVKPSYYLNGIFVIFLVAVQFASKCH